MFGRIKPERNKRVSVGRRNISGNRIRFIGHSVSFNQNAFVSFIVGLIRPCVSSSVYPHVCEEKK